MKQIFERGNQKVFKKTVSQTDLAIFESGKVHDVYATFAIARDAEWSGRLFVLEMKEEDEEGIGTFRHVEHKSPAFLDAEIIYTATFEEISEKGEIITSFEAYCDNRLLAKGSQGQRILKKQKMLIFDFFRLFSFEACSTLRFFARAPAISFYRQFWVW